MDSELLSTEQVRRTMNVYLDLRDLPPRRRELAYANEIAKQSNYQHQNAAASKHHR